MSDIDNNSNNNFNPHDFYNQAPVPEKDPSMGQSGFQFSPVPSGPVSPYPEAPQFQETDNSNRIIDAVGFALRSPAFLIVLICFSINAVFQVIAGFAPLSTSLYSQLNSDFGSVLSNQQILDVMGILRGSQLVVSIITLIPTVIGLIGIYMLFASRYDRPIKTKGYGFIKAYLIVELVLKSVIYGAIIVFSFWATAKMDDLSLEFDAQFNEIFNGAFVGIPGGDNMSPELFAKTLGTTVFLTIGITLLVFLAVTAVFYAFGIKTVSVMKNAGTFGRKTGKPSMFVAVILFVLAGFAVLSVVAANSIMSLVSLAINITMYICIGIFVITLRGMLAPYPKTK